MLKDIKWPRYLSYSSESDHEPFEFYLNALTATNQLDLFLGYFSSAAINVLSLGFAKFLSGKGTVRMIINDVLSNDDKAVLQRVEDGHLYQIPFDIYNFSELKSRLDDYDLHFFNCLGWLVQNNRIEIIPVRPLNKRGIAHYKSGIFSDGRDKVGFNGSCNFTMFGLLENVEKIDVSLSWESAFAKERIVASENEFNHVFSRKATHLEYLNAENLKTAISTTFGFTELDELLINEEELLAKKRAVFQKKKMKSLLETSSNRIEHELDSPCFPYAQGPREYQIEAYEKWALNGYKGLFAMATGTGKTLTSLYCLLNLYKGSGVFRAVILVPTVALVEQWKKECLKFNYNNLTIVSSKEKWDQNISFFNTAAQFIDTSFIIIVTYASFQKKAFQARFQSLPKDTLLIADEVHNMGSPTMLKLLPKIALQLRIGLSATPSRKYDIVGNQEIEKFFNSEMPYTYSFSMKKALDNEWLCKYSYFPHVVSLTQTELDQYIHYSRQLLKYFDPVTKAYKNTPEVEFLLLARKRIIHKAENKKQAFKKIIADEFRKRGNLHFTLVYVPEGLDTNYDQKDWDEDSTDDISLIDEYTKSVSRTDPSILVSKYTSQTKSRDEVIKSFETGKVHVLTSMKCLDEGVDVPRSELAIFCASTGNPRQFIQRRGRVLRLHKDKINAVIHDLVVVPLIADNDNTFEMERTLVSKELERVVDFAKLSMNKSDSYTELKDVLNYYDLNLNDFLKDNED